MGDLLTIDSFEKAPCGVDGQVARGPLLCSLRSWPVHAHPPSLSLVKVRLTRPFFTSSPQLFPSSRFHREGVFSCFLSFDPRPKTTLTPHGPLVTPLFLSSTSFPHLTRRLDASGTRATLGSDNTRPVADTLRRVFMP